MFDLANEKGNDSRKVRGKSSGRGVGRKENLRELEMAWLEGGATR